MKKTFVRLVSHLFPNYMVRMAQQALSNPQVKKLREHELEVLETSQKEVIQFEDFDIHTYTWEGDSNKKILLIHGWEGQAGNFADLIPKLLNQNYTIYAFDAPSHGFSSKGSTSLFEFIKLVEFLIQKHQPQFLVSHSFGGVATTYALTRLPDVEIEKYVLFTTPDKFTERVEDVVRMVGTTQKVKERLIKKMEEDYQLDASKLNVSDFVKQINVKKALILQDKDDKVIPLHRSENVNQNWENAKLAVVEDTGHFRILRTPEVLDKAISFLGGTS